MVVAEGAALPETGWVTQSGSDEAKRQVRLGGIGFVVAAELEFYLQDPQRRAEAEACPTQSFAVDAPERHHALLSDIERHARLQSLPLTGVVAEAASGQYELNLHHSRRVLEACDQIMALKRLTRQIAEQHHQHACFMAKPCAHAAGSGLHFHISLQNEHGENLLTGAPGPFGTFAVEWEPTEWRDETLGRLGGAIHGTVVEFTPGRDFFIITGT